MSAQNFDILSIGDSTVDIFMQVQGQDAEALCKVDEEECLICFAYGSKIPVSDYKRIAAVGNAANNAIGSARLGLNTAIYTVLGSDHDSQETKGVFENEGVATDFVVMESGKRSNLSTVLNYSGERTIFVYHEPKTYKFPKATNTSWAYLTSVGKEHESLHGEVLEWVKSTGAKLGFNPGSYQLRDELEKLRPLFEVTEVLLVNREEAYGLVGRDVEDTKGLIKDLKACGPEVVVITDGPNGSFASIDGREVWQVGIPQTAPVVERTGAGDAYSTGFIAAMVQGLELPEAMIWGTMNATSVVAHIGAREGLLTSLKMKEWVEKYGNQIKPRMI